MKVLHLIQRYAPAVGGSETWCREVCQQLAAAGDEMKVLTLDVIEEEDFWSDPPVERCATRLGRLAWDDRVLVRRYRRSLPVHALYHSLLKIVLDRWLRIYFYGPHSVEMYGRLLSEVRTADIVHLHTVPYPHNLVGYLAARLRGKPVVITPHFHPDHPHYERWSNYWLLKHCDAVIAVSEYERDYLAGKGVSPDRIVITGNGVHVDEYRPTDPARFKATLREAHGVADDVRAIVFIGRKLEYKGIATLVEAFKRLPHKLGAALFLAGPSSAWFDDFYQGLPPSDREKIIDLGVLSHADKVDLLHLADVLVLPSRFEAFGIVLLEAWACGTPVIAASTGAMPGIVSDGGFVFEYGNVDRLAVQIERLLEDGDLASRMGRRGRERLLERYTWGRIASATRCAYGSARAARRQFRVLICSNLFPPHASGGAEIVAHKEALILKDLGVDVEVFCGGLDGNVDRAYRVKAEDGELRKTRVSLSLEDISGEWWNFDNDVIRQRFASVLERFGPHVVHFHNLVGLSAKMIDECEQRRISTVLTLHDYWGICFKNTMLKNDGSVCMAGGFDCLGCKTTLMGPLSTPSPTRNSHILLSLAKVDRFVSPSQYLADRYAANGIPRDRILVMRNGIDPERFPASRREHEVFSLGFIGYLGKHKGLDVLLRALALLPDSGEVRLLVAGDGEERQNLEALCQELRLGHLVTFRGRVQNQHIAAIYAQIDVLVVPSVWPENSPVTITEAMASGIPVIASDIGGVSELVENEVTGLLAPPRDSRALADSIERLRKDAELRSEMGQNALAKIRQEGAKDQVIRLLQVFTQVSSGKREPRDPGFDVLLYSSDRYWDRGVRDMLRQLASLETRLGRRLLLCRMDLCNKDALRTAKLLLLPASGRDSLLHGLKALQLRIPLLVNSTAAEPRELCRQSNAGLVYSDADELRECLATLLTHEALRKALGAKGHAFIQGQGAHASGEGLAKQTPAGSSR
jgi:glycosyltransferase involved in cell wall biosynthesis